MRRLVMILSPLLIVSVYRLPGLYRKLKAVRVHALRMGAACVAHPHARCRQVVNVNLTDRINEYHSCILDQVHICSHA